MSMIINQKAYVEMLEKAVAYLADGMEVHDLMEQKEMEQVLAVFTKKVTSEYFSKGN